MGCARCDDVVMVTLVEFPMEIEEVFDATAPVGQETNA